MGYFDERFDEAAFSNADLKRKFCSGRTHIGTHIKKALLLQQAQALTACFRVIPLHSTNSRL
ncbi:hypothetical protein [Ruthenibacterium lactatiformans]|uniref:hypothetical protein n=1 Tax=Ruthenibacterium lactatiformans TaxID=1550024 RepID=UPI003AB7C376